MMRAVPLPIDPSDEAIFVAVDRWIDDLARGDYDSAFVRTEHDSYFGWTVELLRRVIEGYGLPEPHPTGTVFAVTPRLTATGGPPTRVVDRSPREQDRLPHARYDLPLNGKWSDLTATFRVDARGDHSVLVLEEIHVF